MYGVNIMMCNWNWYYVIQWLHNILFLLLTARSRQFRQNVKYFNTQPSFLSLSTGVKRAVFTADLPLKDIPQKSLVRRTVNVRGSLIRAVICHFKRRNKSKSRYQRRLTAVPHCKQLVKRIQSHSVKRFGPAS